jgi:hypothetical protein
MILKKSEKVIKEKKEEEEYLFDVNMEKNNDGMSND